MSRVSKRDSPPFCELLSWLKKGDVQSLGRVFPLREWTRHRADGKITGKRLYWDRIKHRKYLSHIDLDEFRVKLKTELVDPLFLKPGIKIKDEDKRRKDNLFSLTEALYYNLRDEEKDLRKTIEDYHQNFREFFPQIKSKPFYWVLTKSDDRIERELRKNLDELGSRIEDIWQLCRRLNDDLLEKTFQNWRVFLNEQDEDFLARRHVEPPDMKRKMAVDEAQKILDYLRSARGKPGRHPKPFNVLVYHLINWCTTWKLDKNRQYVFRSDGQHRLERDWGLILFLLLDVHVNYCPLRELDKFITKNAKKPAPQALRSLKKKLWDIYKNFPPLHGWPMQKEGIPSPETGFRKLIVTDDGNLRIVRL